VLLAVLGGRERPLEVVDDRQQLADEPALGALACRGGLAGRALAVVLEVGLDPLGQREVVLGLLLGLSRLLGVQRLLLVRRVLLAGGLTPLVARRGGLLLRGEGRVLRLEHG
jgi:hypothetical protein